METKLIVYFDSEGEKPTVVVDRIVSAGFEVTQGKYDFVYKWDKEPTNAEILELGDKLVDALKGSNVRFKLETA